MVRSALKNTLVAKCLPIALGKGRFLDPGPELRIAAKVNYGLATAFIMLSRPREIGGMWVRIEASLGVSDALSGSWQPSNWEARKNLDYTS